MPIPAMSKNAPTVLHVVTREYTGMGGGDLKVRNDYRLEDIEDHIVAEGVLRLVFTNETMAMWPLHNIVRVWSD